jgi:hypothetical protein
MDIKRLIYFIIPMAVSACGSTGVYPVGSDLYYVSQRSWQLELGFSSITESTLMSEARSFCVEKGETLVPIEVEVKDSVLLQNGRVSMTFRCVDAPK